MVRILNEYDSEKIVSRYVACVNSVKIKPDKLLLEKLKYPIYIKIMSPKANHKVKSGAIFRIENKNVLKAQIKKIKAKYKTLQGKFLIVQPEIKGEEFILGINKDEKFGYMMMLGIGGWHSEQLKDVVFRKLPITRKDADEMISSLRNQAVVLNIKKGILTNAMLKIQNIAKDSKIQTIDLNPIKVDKKAIVVDARIYLR